MAELQKGASSSVNSKEKDSLLDLDFGKDFLSSWKSMSMTGDDTMDLDFGPVSKGKKKAFNFDNTELDFNLDGDFGKMPSFNIDMPDIDISSPLKKDAKNKEKPSEEPDSGNNKGKADRFSFTFDFNQLDGFDFNSSLMKQDKKTKKNEDEDNSSNRNGFENSGDKSAEDNVAHDDGISRNLAQPGAASTLDSRVGAGAILDSTIENCISNSVTNDKNHLNSMGSIDEVTSHKPVTSPAKTISTKNQEFDCQPDKSISKERVSEEDCISSEAIQELPVHSACRNELSGDAVPKLQEDVSSGATRHAASSEKNSGGSQVRCDDHALVGNREGAESAQGESLVKHSSVPNAARESIAKEKSNVKNQKALEPSTNQLSSRTIPNNLMPEKEKEAFFMRSKYFKRPEKIDSHSQIPSNHTKLSSLIDKRSSTRQPHLVDERKDDAKEAQHDAKLADVSVSHSGAPCRDEHLELGSQECCKGPNLNRPVDQEVITGKSLSRTGDKNVKSLDSFRLTGKTNRLASQDSVSSAAIVAGVPTIPSMKNSIADGEKASSSKVMRQMPALSSLKISRTSGVNLDLSKSIPQNNIRILKDVEANKVLVASIPSKSAQFVETKEQTPLTPSLKRKTFETSNTDMVSKPSKRLSESPSNGNSDEISTKVIGEKPCNNEKVIDGTSTSVLDTSQNSKLDVHWGANTNELEITFSIENDSNVEKAEACSNELKDICSMLRKKREEAKEILVRAIVNNNKLLMLNHPLYEEKIRMVQKFAAQLSLRELVNKT